MVTCSKCRQPLGREVYNTAVLTHCPSCGVTMKASVFPALYQQPDRTDADDAFLVEGDASCFYHPNKKAVVPCSSCGRFLCSLCDVEFDNRHLCPACLESGQKKHKIKNLENQRTLYDNMALSLAIVPIIFVWLTIITAPIVLILSVKYWKAPTSILGRTKIRFVLAMIIASAEIAVWVMFLLAVWT